MIAALLLCVVLTPTPAATPAPRILTPDLTCRVRDAHGVVIRSRARRDLFKRRTGFPHGRPGYVVDHVIPLACGGCDLPSNMQWQTIEDGKAKDRWELKTCGGQ